MTASGTSPAFVGRRTVLLLAKWLFILGSVVYLVHFFRSSISFSEIRSLASTALLIRLAAASLLFAGTAALCVISWRTILLGLSFDRSYLAVARVFCVTQVGKYLPGNIGHHIGRVAASGTSLGISAQVAVISVLQESALACLAALAVALSGFMLCRGGRVLFLDLPASKEVLPIWILVALLIASITALWLIDRMRFTRWCVEHRALNWITRVVPRPWTAFVAGLPLFGVFFLNGLALWLLADGIRSVVLDDLCVLSAAYAMAWVAGFVVPGAPGGLGVREAVLVSLLGEVYPPDIAFAITIASRICSIGADALILLCGLLIPVSIYNEEPKDSIHG